MKLFPAYYANHPQAINWASSLSWLDEEPTATFESTVAAAAMEEAEDVAADTDAGYTATNTMIDTISTGHADKVNDNSTACRSHCNVATCPLALSHFHGQTLNCQRALLNHHFQPQELEHSEEDGDKGVVHHPAISKWLHSDGELNIQMRNM